MRTTYRPPITRPIGDNFSKVFERVTGSISKTTLEKLQELSKKKCIPLSVLVGRAIDNEFNSENPFHRNLTMPNERLSDIEHSEGAKNLYALIKNSPGLSLEHFMVLKGDLNILDDERVKLEYLHLLELDLIHEYQPRNAKFDHPPEYRVVAIKPDTRVIEKIRRRKNIEPTKGPLDDLD